MSKLDEPRRLLLQTRALLVVDAPLAPPPASGWFRWIKRLPDVVPPTARWYMDGSFLDGPSPLTGRTGFAIAVVDDGGHLLACAYGAPPCWIRNSAGAEAWALLTVLHHCPVMPILFTDCLGLISKLARGKTAATGHDRPLARLWRLIFAAVDGAVPLESLHTTFVWVPAHRSRQAVGQTLRSDGQPLTLENWRANRLVDFLAKAAAGRYRVPGSTLRLLADATAAVSYSAALLGGRNPRRQQLRRD